MRIGWLAGLMLCCLGCGDDTPAPMVDSRVCVNEVCNGRDDDCNGLVDDGIDFSNDPTNCGACRVSCRVPNGAGVCARASCQRQVLICDPTFGDCDEDGDNGCEQDLFQLDHCGACGVICAPENGLGNCATGVCALMGCEEGFDSCDSDDDNGCEQDLTADLNHCGACDNACDTAPHADAVCDRGSCGLLCHDGFADCDSTEAGCETATLEDPAHCGGCDLPCELDDSCINGVCTPP